MNRQRSGGDSRPHKPAPAKDVQSSPLLAQSLEMTAHLDALGTSPSGSDKRRNKKGIVISHLVTFAPRQRTTSNDHVRPVRRHKSQRSSTYSRETYLQNNCRFRVKHDGDYTTVLADPDQMVDWDKIVEVMMTVTEVPRCPICLGSPIAAKITRCGHIYCWPVSPRFCAVVIRLFSHVPTTTSAFFITLRNPKKLGRVAPCATISFMVAICAL